MARNVFSRSRKCSGQGSLRSSTGFSTAGASEPILEASDGAIEGSLPTSTSRVGSEDDAETVAVTDRAFRARVCLLPTGGGVTGIGGISLTLLEGEEGGGMDRASGRGVMAGATLERPFCRGSGVALDGGDTIWKSSSSSSDLISIISGSFLMATRLISRRVAGLGDARKGSSVSASSSDLISRAIWVCGCLLLCGALTRPTPEAE